MLQCPASPYLSRHQLWQSPHHLTLQRKLVLLRGCEKRGTPLRSMKKKIIFLLLFLFPVQAQQPRCSAQPREASHAEHSRPKKGPRSRSEAEHRPRSPSSPCREMALRARRTSPRRSPAAGGEERQPFSLVCALLPLTPCWEYPALATCGGCILVAEFFAFHAEQNWLLRRRRRASPAASEQRGKGKSPALST